MTERINPKDVETYWWHRRILHFLKSKTDKDLPEKDQPYIDISEFPKWFKHDRNLIDDIEYLSRNNLIFYSYKTNQNTYMPVPIKSKMKISENGIIFFSWYHQRFLGSYIIPALISLVLSLLVKLF